MWHCVARVLDSHYRNRAIIDKNSVILCEFSAFLETYLSIIDNAYNRILNWHGAQERKPRPSTIVSIMAIERKWIKRLAGAYLDNAR